jgi:hypothetical protein
MKKLVTAVAAALISTSALSAEYLGDLSDKPFTITSPSSPVETATSHSGGTDKCGCHYNRKTGEYHCHTRKQRGGDCPP